MVDAVHINVDNDTGGIVNFTISKAPDRHLPRSLFAEENARVDRGNNLGAHLVIGLDADCLHLMILSVAKLEPITMAE